MSAVEFVRNVDAHTSVYRWEAAGVAELTRQNKLTSLPFWLPNAQTRTHQFRLVLLRGLVPATDAAKDPFGVLVEFIAPPPSPTSATPSDSPGGCAVTCEVLPISDSPTAAESRATTPAATGGSAVPTPKKSISATRTVVIDEDNAQVSFAELIPSDVLQNSHYVSGSPKSFTLQVTIETGISVPLHQAASTAYSFFSAITSSVGQLLGNTAHLYHEGRESLNSALLAPSASVLATSAELWHGTAAGGGGAPATTATAAHASSVFPAAGAAPPLPPWERPPEEWRERPEAWRSLVCTRLPSFDGAYRHGLEKVLAADEVALLAEVGLVESDLYALFALFDLDRDVQENLLTSSELRTRRYRLVPAKLKDEVFWANYFWKLHCVGQCVTERQVAAILATLCTPTRAGHADFGVAGNASEGVLREIGDGEEVAALLEHFIERNEATEPWCAVVAESARHCTTVLEVTAQRTDLSAQTQAQVHGTLAELEEVLGWYAATLADPGEDVTGGVLVPCEATAATTALAEGRTPTADVQAPAADASRVDAPVTEEGQRGAAQEAAVSVPAQGSAAPSPARDDGSASTPLKASRADFPAADASPAPAPPSVPTAATPAASPSPSAVAPPPPRPSVGQVEFTKMPWEEED